MKGYTDEENAGLNVFCIFVWEILRIENTAWFIVEMLGLLTVYVWSFSVVIARISRVHVMKGIWVYLFWVICQSRNGTLKLRNTASDIASVNRGIKKLDVRFRLPFATSWPLTGSNSNTFPYRIFFCSKCKSFVIQLKRIAENLRCQSSKPVCPTTAPR